MSMQEAILPGQEAEIRLLLSAYLAIETELKTQAATVRRDIGQPTAEEVAESLEIDGDEDTETATIGWVPRLRQVAGIPDARLGPLHGQLIALGLLKFELTGRTSGILYRLSPEGRARLQRPDETAFPESSAA